VGLVRRLSSGAIKQMDWMNGYSLGATGSVHRP
jgi:hypothetical protein